MCVFVHGDLGTTDGDVNFERQRIMRELLMLTPEQIHIVVIDDILSLPQDVLAEILNDTRRSYDAE